MKLYRYRGMLLRHLHCREPVFKGDWLTNEPVRASHKWYQIQHSGYPANRRSNQFVFAREVDPLIAAMIRVKEENDSADA